MSLTDFEADEEMHRKIREVEKKRLLKQFADAMVRKAALRRT